MPILTTRQSSFSRGAEDIAGLRVPTLMEMARIKAWLLATRDTTRD